MISLSYHFHAIMQALISFLQLRIIFFCHGFQPYIFRHSFLTMVFQKGVPAIIFRPWVFGSGFSVLGFRYWVFGTGFSAMGFRHWVFGHGLRQASDLIFNQENRRGIPLPFRFSPLPVHGNMELQQYAKGGDRSWKRKTIARS